MGSSRVKFGTCLFQWRGTFPLDSDFSSMVRFAAMAEEMGFDSVCVPDQALFPFEPLTTLAAVAMRTDKAKLITCVIDPNRRNPATLAQITSTLDIVSGGRFIFGVGKGVGNDEVYGFHLSKPVRRMLESIQVIKKLWIESKVSFAGDFYRFENASISPKPLQKPHPPIWVAAFGPRMMRIAAQHGDGFISQNLPPELYGRKLNEVLNLAKRVGRDPKKIVGVFAAPISISSDYSTAFRSIEPFARSFLLRNVWTSYLAEYLGFRLPWTKLEDVPVEAIERCYIFGTPNDCISKIERYIKEGVTYFISLPILPFGENSLRLFADKVLPHFMEG